MKLKEALDYFLNVDRSRQTRRQYARMIGALVTAIGPDRPLELVRIEDLEAYIFDLRNHPDAPLKDTSIHQTVKVIKVFFRWCVKRRYLVRSPAQDIRNPTPIRPFGLEKAATDSELSLMLAGVQFNRRDRALLLLFAQSGCRAAEAADVQISRLDLDHCAALIIGKGNRQRRIFFGPETASALRAWLTERPAVHHDFVFTSTRLPHNPMTAEAASRVVQRLSKKVGLGRILGSHSLRHRVGATFGREHVPVRVAQAYLGHSRPEITFKYYQDVDEADLHRAADLLHVTLPPASEDEKRQKEIIERFLKSGRSSA